MNKFSKKEYIDIIKEMKIDQGNIIEYKDSGDVEINIKGKKMQKISKEISLKSIYNLVVNIMNDVKELKQDISNMKIDINQLKKDVKELKQDISNMKININQLKNDVKKLKSLPTIKRELKQNNFL